jgi:hypothetical protein
VITTLAGTVAAAVFELVNVTVRSFVRLKGIPTVPVEAVAPAFSFTADGFRLSVSAGTVKIPVLTAVPPDVVTVIGPVVTPVGAVAVIEVALFTVNEVAATPLNRTAVAPVKSVPVTVTIVPPRPKAGLISVIVGAVPPPPPLQKREKSSIP